MYRYLQCFWTHLWWGWRGALLCSSRLGSRTGPSAPAAVPVCSLLWTFWSGRLCYLLWCSLRLQNHLQPQFSLFQSKIIFTYLIFSILTCCSALSLSGDCATGSLLVQPFYLPWEHLAERLLYHPLVYLNQNKLLSFSCSGQTIEAFKHPFLNRAVHIID